jgi:hypothetical protein
MEQVSQSITRRSEIPDRDFYTIRERHLPATEAAEYRAERERRAGGGTSFVVLPTFEAVTSACSAPPIKTKTAFALTCFSHSLRTARTCNFA